MRPSKQRFTTQLVLRLLELCSLFSSIQGHRPLPAFDQVHWGRLEIHWGAKQRWYHHPQHNLMLFLGQAH